MASILAHDTIVGSPKSTVLAHDTIVGEIPSKILVHSGLVTTLPSLGVNEDIAIGDQVKLTSNINQVVVDDIQVSDKISILSEINNSIFDDIIVSDQATVIQAQAVDLPDDINIADNIIVNVDLEKANSVEDITVTDNITVNVDLEKAADSSDITVTDTANIYATTGPVSFASKIISFNPLIIVSDESPLTIVKVDVTDPNNPTWQKYKIGTVSNAKDVIYDSILNLIFVVCADGKILQVDSNDFTTYTVFDTGDLNDLLKVAIFEGYYRIYAGTDDNTGELLTLDNRITSKIKLDITCLQTINTILGLEINSVNVKNIGTNIQCLGIRSLGIGMDIRIIPQPIYDVPTPPITDPIILFNELASKPIKQTDFHVYVDGVEFTDVELDSIRIYHTVGEKSTAGFKLRRRHDNFNKTITGTSAIIDQQNLVNISIQNRTEFTGNITTVNTFSEDEVVEVICLGSEKTSEKRNVDIPLSGLNSKLGLWDCMVNNPVYYNPILDLNDKNPQFYKGIKVDLGTRVYPNIRINSAMGWQYSTPIGQSAGGNLAEMIQAGTFIPDQNWTYYWKIAAKNYYTGAEYTSQYYTGTSIAPLSSDLWKITSASFERQRKFYDTEQWMGTYQIGEAPFKTVSVRNGAMEVRRSYRDGKGYWIQEFNSGYDYGGYARQVADLEYEKLKNINGTVLPIASTSIDLLLDGYYYYGLKLLTRINIDNTIASGIFKNSHGFPVAIKSINISSDNMQVTLTCDNGLSSVELAEIDAKYPDVDSSDYTYERQSWFLARKFDFNKGRTLTSQEIEQRGKSYKSI